MSEEMSKEAYIALQMACELRQIITDLDVGGAPEYGLAGDSYPMPPFPGESFEDACRRIFGDYVFNKVTYERMPHEKKYPEKYYKNFKPKGPTDAIQLPLKAVEDEP